MAAIDFPNTPVLGQQFTSGGVTWTFDGTKWTPGPNPPGWSDAPNDGTSYERLNSAWARDAYQANNVTFRNRIINGDMRWDQRNEGASVTVNAQLYGPDRFKLSTATINKFSGQRVAGWGQFPYALKFTSLSAYVSLAADFFVTWQGIEADTVYDLQWGTAAAVPVVLSFFAQASVTGAYSGVIKSQDSSRSYGFTYTITTANIPQKFAIQIPGDTGGTTTNWPISGNNIWGYVIFDLGSGSNSQAPSAGSWLAANYNAVAGSQKLVATNGAVLNITGVQLEVGTAATPFEVLPPDVSLARCMRYYEKSYAQGTALGTVGVSGMETFALNGLPAATYTGYIATRFKAMKRIVPTIVVYSPGSGASGQLRNYIVAGDVAAIAANTGVSGLQISTAATLASAGGVSIGAHWTADADF